MKANVRDVARLAGVSPATVSRVLNDLPGVQDMTRSRILAAMQELGYQAGKGVAAAGTVRNSKRKTSTLGVVLADITNPFYSESAQVIIERAQELGCQVVICTTQDSREMHRQCVELLVKRRVDGLLLASVRHQDPRVAALIRAGFPCIQYNRRLDPELGNYIVLDNHAGAYRATEYLIQLGHRRVAFLKGPDDCSTSVERLAGHLDAMRAYHLEPAPDLVRNCGFQGIQAFAATRELLQRPSRPTAIFSSNDSMALGVLEAAVSCGLQVPRDLSVLGFDDVDITSHRLINLTTVSQNKREMGRLAVEKLMELISGQCQDPVRLMLEPALVVRGTCAPPPAEAVPGD